MKRYLLMPLLLIVACLIGAHAEARSPYLYINGSGAGGAFVKGANQPTSFKLNLNGVDYACVTEVLTAGVRGRCELLHLQGFTSLDATVTTVSDGGQTVTKAKVTASELFNCTQASATAGACTLTMTASVLAAPPPPPPPVVTYTWTRVASENASFTATGTVRFGIGTTWVEKAVTGTSKCSLAVFGSDPAPGRGKFCELRSAQ